MAYVYQSLDGFPNFRGEPTDTSFYKRLVENQCSLKEEVGKIPDLANINSGLVPRYEGQYDLGSDTLPWRVVWGQMFSGQYLTSTSSNGVMPGFNFNDAPFSGMGLVDSKTALWSNGYVPLEAGTNGVRLSAANSEQLEFVSNEAGKEGSWKLGGNSDSFVLKKDNGTGAFIEKVKVTDTEVFFGLPINGKIPKRIINVAFLEQFEVDVDQDAIFFIEIGTDETLANAPTIWGEAGEEITFIISHESAGTLTLSANISAEEKMPFVLTSDIILSAGDTITFIRMPNGLYRKQ